MSLSFEEFVNNCEEMVDLSCRFPGCEWKRHDDSISGRLQFIAHSNLRMLDNGESCVFQYHVMYSESYNVPILYFNAWLRDGKLMRLEDVWQKITKVDKNCVGLDPWTVLTQQEHPYLHQPWFTVHPCKTEEMMRKLINIDIGKKLKNYVVSWLSAVSPLVDLELPLEFADFTL